MKNRYFAFLSLIVAIFPAGLVASDTVAASKVALAGAVNTYWQAIALRDWETAYTFELPKDQPVVTEPEVAAQTKAEAPAETASGPATDAVPRIAEQERQAYILRKHRSLGTMVGFDIREVLVDEGGLTGRALVAVRKPIKAAKGNALRELTFTDHWEISDGQWKRRGTKKGEKVATAIVAASGVRMAPISGPEQETEETEEDEEMRDVPRYDLSSGDAQELGEPAEAPAKSGDDD